MHRRESFKNMAWLVESTLVSWFFFQAMRYLPGAIYSHISSADIVLRLGMPDATTTAVAPATVQTEVVILAIAMVAAVLTFLLGRRPVYFMLAVALAAVGRVFMTLDDPFLSLTGAAVLVAGAMMYWGAMARQIPMRFAPALVCGLLVDQIVRAVGHTFDPTWTEDYLLIQTILSVILFVLVIIRVGFGGKPVWAAVSAHSGISLVGGLSFGAFLFLQITLLGLPNAVARWSGLDYHYVAPFVFVATAMALLPSVRDAARRLLTLVDSQWRGWFYLLIIALFLVIGNRIPALAGGTNPGAGLSIISLISLLLAQLMVVLSAWWIVRPVAEDERDWSGLGLVVTMLIFIVLFGADFFTYEYAYVRDFGGNLDRLSATLRALRGAGFIVMLVAATFVATPLMETGRRIPWLRGQRQEFLAGLLAMVAGAVVIVWFALPPTLVSRTGLQQLRVASYDIHGGYSLFFDYTLETMADTIWESGADVVLLQEVEAGRTVSYGVDQVHWLSRRLGMDAYYLPTNERLQGIAILARVPVSIDEGTVLAGSVQPTGLQRIQVQAGNGTVDIYNTWLGLLYATDQAALVQQEQDQWLQLNQSLAIIAANHPGGVVDRVLFGGTFNNTPESQLYTRMVEVGFTDPFAGMPLANAATLLRGDAIQARIDYLWLRNILPTGRAVLSSDASDHRLSVVELNLAE